VFVETVRFVFTVLGALAGYQLAAYLQRGGHVSFLQHGYVAVAYGLLALLGGLIGFVLGGVVGRLFVRLVDRMEGFLSKRTAAEVVVGTVGLLVGLGIAALSSLAVIHLPGGPYLLVPLFVILGYAFAYLAARKDVEILRLVGLGDRGADDPLLTPPRHIVDTSSIIDGRIVDIVETGFLCGELVVPGFVLAELQRVADSADPEKRLRGRRGLDLVRKLMAATDAAKVVDDDYADLNGVDDKLVRLGQDMGADVLTTDFNLAKVAEIKGVRVLNVNELANAVKTSVLPGEEIEVRVLREGREPAQGVGYLDDGTMIVVEDGKSMVGSTVRAQVTSVLQNPSGKMIFTKMVRP
jgi:uncharacterized protein YacL